MKGKNHESGSALLRYSHLMVCVSPLLVVIFEIADGIESFSITYLVEICWRHNSV